MAVTGSTQLVATKQDLIAALVQKELKYQAKLLPTITDVSVFAVKGSKSISFPKAGSFAVENRASAASGSLQDLTFSTDTLNIDYRAFVAWSVDSVDEYQSNVEVQAHYVKMAATAHARNIDELILSQLDTYSGYQQAAGIDQSKILNARKWLLKNQANVADCKIVVNADDESLLLAIPDFVRADAYGFNSQNISTGVIGRIYGMDVLVHTKPTLAKSFIYSKDAVLFGLQKGPQYDEQKNILIGTGAMIAAVDQCYGLKSARLTEGLDFAGVALAAGKSPFIAEIG